MIFIWIIKYINLIILLSNYIHCSESIFHAYPQVRNTSELNNLKFKCGYFSPCFWKVHGKKYSESNKTGGNPCEIKLHIFSKYENFEMTCSFMKDSHWKTIKIKIFVLENTQNISKEWCAYNSVPYPVSRAYYYESWNSFSIQYLPLFPGGHERKGHQPNVYRYEYSYKHVNIILLNLYKQSSFTIDCTVIGDPKPVNTYLWNGKIIEPNNTIATIEQYQITIHFNQMKVKSGMLTCKATNNRSYDLCHYMIYTVNQPDVKLNIDTSALAKPFPKVKNVVSFVPSEYEQTSMLHSWLYSQQQMHNEHRPDVIVPDNATSLYLSPNYLRSDCGGCFDFLYLIVCDSPSERLARCVCKLFRFEKGRFEYYFKTSTDSTMTSTQLRNTTGMLATSTAKIRSPPISSVSILSYDWMERMLLIACLAGIAIILFIFLIVYCRKRFETSGCRDACFQIARIIRKSNSICKADQVTYVRNANYGSSAYFLPLVNQSSVTSSVLPRHLSHHKPSLSPCDKLAGSHFPLLHQCNVAGRQSEASTYLSVVNQTALCAPVKPPVNNFYNQSPANQKRAVSHNQSHQPTNRVELPEISKSRLIINKQIGSGAFGRVFSGKLYSIDKSTFEAVAVKELINNTEETSDWQMFIKEFEIMKMVGYHKNIVCIKGCCLDYGESPLIVMEMCSKGSLKNYLESLSFNNYPSPDLLLPQLMQFAYDIVCGMVHLADRKIIHRDLAARNIVLNDDYCCKITDFGLSRQLPTTSEYYQRVNGTLPLKWMAPEVTRERKFSLKADVWSFGILLWEIFSLGENPYPNFNIDQINDLVKNGYRMPPPKHCPPLISTLMMRCWKYIGKERPTFLEIQQIFQHSPQLSNI